MIYVYRCYSCMKQYEVQKPLAECDDPVPCKICEKEMVKILTPIRFRIN